MFTCVNGCLTTLNLIKKISEYFELKGLVVYLKLCTSTSFSSLNNYACNLLFKKSISTNFCFKLLVRFLIVYVIRGFDSYLCRQSHYVKHKTHVLRCSLCLFSLVLFNQGSFGYLWFCYVYVLICLVNYVSLFCFFFVSLS